MFSKVFLARISGNMDNDLPARFAYMALHFSPYSKGLSNIPATLPKGSILLLDDSMTPDAHDPVLITEQLTELAKQFMPAGILLDFQKPKTQALERIAAAILQALPCPVGATKEYAKALGCPVFLPPPSANKALADHISPWLEQGVYLEIAPEGLEFTVTEEGSSCTRIPFIQGLKAKDERIHCHYKVEVFSDKVIYTICRDKEDLAALVQEAEALGVLGCVGLYEELQN